MVASFMLGLNVHLSGRDHTSLGIIMFEFVVQDMTCGHCVATITKAFNKNLPDAIVDIDLDARKVSVRGVADAATAVSVFAAAGYAAQQTT